MGETEVVLGEGDAALAGSPLLESRGELEAILRQVKDGITVQDASGALVYANALPADRVRDLGRADGDADRGGDGALRDVRREGERSPSKGFPADCTMRGLEAEEVIRCTAPRLRCRALVAGPSSLIFGEQRR